MLLSSGTTRRGSPWCRSAWRKPCDQISTRPLLDRPRRHRGPRRCWSGNTTLALRGDGDPPGRTRGNRAVPAACLAVDGHPAPASRGLHDALAAWDKATSLLPEQPLQLTTRVEYAQRMLSVRNEQAAAATRRGWYRADPRAYIRIAAVLRERIIAGELVPGHATPSITRLCAGHGVARQTAAHALHVLQDAGLV